MGKKAMLVSSSQKSKTSFDYLPFNEKHYKEFKRKNLIRLLLTYLTPLIILTTYFYYQYDAMVSESRHLHLKAIAENQSNTFDLFINERVVNLSNLINDPRFHSSPSSEDMLIYLERLKQNSKAFTDIGYFDSSGVQIAYAGPFPSLEKRDYSTESWYINLKEQEKDFIITDIYLGLRNKPHFTIAIKKIINDQLVVLRTSLDPERMYEYITSLEGSREVSTSIVNREGFYQLVTPQIGSPLEASSFVPPETPKLGIGNAKINETSDIYAYSWLETANWALVVQKSSEVNQNIFSGYRMKIIGISLILMFLITIITYYRAGKIVEFQKETDRTRAQLEHAAKLASVGELAAGIAHEINNPLAIINEEAGLMKDLLTAEFGETPSHEEMIPYLDTIQESVFRCRDITRKLLGFVRKTDLDISPHDIHEIIDEVVDGILGKEMEVSNIDIIRNYDKSIPQITTDSNQLQQVLLNILNNAIDAIEDNAGKIIITTKLRKKKKIQILISDSGTGISREQIEKIFLPFYSTKEVGKGTGLGLSVSYGIIKSLGGKIEAESSHGEGSTFIITLPTNSKY
jgi:two-component system NtrC family sensor kinase